MWRLRIAVALGLLLLVQQVRADIKNVTPDFSQYPQTFGLKLVVSMQTEDSVFNAHRSHLLVVSAFVGGGAAYQQSVAQNGQEFGCLNSFNFAAEGGRRNQLSEEQLKTLRTSLNELPKESEFPPMDHLVIISFLDGSNWITRSYSKDKLPEALRKIYAIIGASPEGK